MLNPFLSIDSILNNNLLGTPRRWLGQKIHLWLRPLIIVGVLLSSAALAYKGSPLHLQLALALPFGISAVLLFMRWPPLGLVALIGTIIIPINGPSGSNASMALVALLFGLWIMDMMVRQRKIQLRLSLPTWPLLALILVASLSFGVGQLPWYTFAESAPLGAQLGGLAIFLLSAGAFLLVAYRAPNLFWLKWIVWLFITIGGVYITARLVPGSARLITQVLSTGATGSLFWTWLVALAFSQAVFNRNLHLGWRLALGTLLVMTFYVAYFQDNEWKSGWIPPLITILAIVGFRFWWLVLAISPFGFLPASYLISKIIATDQYSYGTRIDAWLIVAEIIKANPILGLGFANYRWYTPLFPIRGYAVYFVSHSQYVDIIAQTGLLGLVCFLWFFGAVGWLGWRLRKCVPTGFAQAYVYGALGGLVGTLVAGALGDWVLPFFYNIGMNGFRASVLGWLFLGGLVALEQMYCRSASKEAIE